MTTLALPNQSVENRIVLLRGHRVLLDSDLAELYGVETRILNQAVTRNANRFPSDFMFQLTVEEAGNLRFQFGTSSLRSQFGISKHGGRRYRPYAFACGRFGPAW